MALRKPPISLALLGGRLLASGHGEWEEADWGKAGLAARGRLLKPARAAEALRLMYRRLSHRRFLLYPRVKAFLPVGVPDAEYLLWDGVLRASGALDWEMSGIEQTVVPGSNHGYSLLVYLAADVVAVSLLKGRQKVASEMLQAGAEDLGIDAAATVAAAAVRRRLGQYAKSVSADEAGMLASAEMLLFASTAPTESEARLRNALGGIGMGGAWKTMSEPDLEAAIRQALVSQ